MPVGIPCLEEREQFPQLFDRRSLRGARLEQLSLLEELHDRVQTPPHLLVAGLLEDAAEDGRPTGIARGEDVRQAEKGLLQVAVLGEQLLLARRQCRRLPLGARGTVGARPEQEQRQDDRESRPWRRAETRRPEVERGGAHGLSRASLARCRWRLIVSSRISSCVRITPRSSSITSL